MVWFPYRVYRGAQHAISGVWIPMEVKVLQYRHPKSEAVEPNKRTKRGRSEVLSRELDLPASPTSQ